MSCPHPKLLQIPGVPAVLWTPDRLGLSDPAERMWCPFRARVPGTPEQFRREAVELVRKSGRPIKEIATDLGVTEQWLRNWVKQADVDQGRSHGLSSEEKEELRRLRREVRVLREEREILKKVSLAARGAVAFAA